MLFTIFVVRPTAGGVTTGGHCGVDAQQPRGGRVGEGVRGHLQVCRQMYVGEVLKFIINEIIVFDHQNMYLVLVNTCILSRGSHALAVV